MEAAVWDQDSAWAAVFRAEASRVVAAPVEQVAVAQVVEAPEVDQAPQWIPVCGALRDKVVVVAEPQEQGVEGVVLEVSEVAVAPAVAVVQVPPLVDFTGPALWAVRVQKEEQEREVEVEAERCRGSGSRRQPCSEEARLQVVAA